MPASISAAMTEVRSLAKRSPSRRAAPDRIPRLKRNPTSSTICCVCWFGGTPPENPFGPGDRRRKFFLSSQLPAPSDAEHRSGPAPPAGDRHSHKRGADSLLEAQEEVRG